MANKYTCGKCDSAISARATVVECCLCFTWYHRGCTRLTSAEFTKICAEYKKSKKHSWNCDKCTDVKVMSPSHSAHDNLNQAARSNIGASDNSNGTNNTWSDLGLKIQDKIVNKQNVDMGDIVLIILQFFNAINDQNAKLQGILEDIRELNKDKNDNFSKLEGEMRSLREDLERLKVPTQSPCSDGTENKTENLYSEIQDRANRSKNIIIYDIPESSAHESADRIAYDKNQVNRILAKIDIKCDNYKAFRLGRAAEKPRPLKVVLHNSDLVSTCMKNKKMLKSSNIHVSADLTQLQREEIRNAHQELERRKQIGESGLYIRYVNGSPKVLVNKISKASKNDQ